MAKGSRVAGLVSAIVLFAAVVGCSGGGDDSKPVAKASGDSATPSKKAGRAYDPATSTAVVSGRVTFEGTPPPSKRVRMDPDPYCASANKGGVERASFPVGPGGGLESTFVYVSGGLGGFTFEVPEIPARLDQQACSYVPGVVGVQAGQPLEIRNSDSTLHNVHAMPEKSRGFNIGMPTKDMISIRKFTEPEVLVRFKCDVHPWMEAYVGVVEHPLYSIADAGGGYRIEGLPAGQYTVEAVHYRLGRKTATVTLPAGGKEKVDFTFSE